MRRRQSHSTQVLYLPSITMSICARLCIVALTIVALAVVILVGGIVTSWPATISYLAQFGIVLGIGLPSFCVPLLLGYASLTFLGDRFCHDSGLSYAIATLPSQSISAAGEGGITTPTVADAAHPPFLGDRSRPSLLSQRSTH